MQKEAERESLIEKLLSLEDHNVGLREANDTLQMDNIQLAGRLNDVNDRRMEDEEGGYEREGTEVRMEEKKTVERGKYKISSRR